MWSFDVLLAWTSCWKISQVADDLRNHCVDVTSPMEFVTQVITWRCTISLMTNLIINKQLIYVLFPLHSIDYLLQINILAPNIFCYIHQTSQVLKHTMPMWFYSKSAKWSMNSRVWEHTLQRTTKAYLALKLPTHVPLYDVIKTFNVTVIWLDV